VLEITQADIDAGVRHDAYHCPIANALQRKLGTSCSARPYIGELLAPWQQRWNEFIARFDAGEPVKPTKLDFPPVDGMTKLNCWQLAKERGLIGYVSSTR
jgi:hypothetical protein